MNDNQTIESMLKQNNGIITSSQVTEAGIPRRCLSEMVSDNSLCKIARGVYALPEAWEDEMHILQYRYRRGIFSHDTALFLHGMSDRTPAKFTMTFPHGYHTASIKNENIQVKLVVTYIYELGIIKKPSTHGNLLRVYDIERTLCDVVKGSSISDIQVVNQAMKTYALSKTKDINKLLEYAEKLRVKNKVLAYMEILL